MKLVTHNFVSNYSRSDDIFNLLSIQNNTLTTNTCSQWLLTSLPKRAIYSSIYNDVISGKFSNKSVLDIGGGITALTPLLNSSCDYTLCDILSHDKESLVSPDLHDCNILNQDWLTIDPNKKYDLVIANDIFPNVDQRLSQFLDKFLKVSARIILSLTFYTYNRSYLVKRCDAEEYLTFLAWNHTQLHHCLEQYSQYILDYNISLLRESLQSPSVFPNKRQVVLIELCN